VRGLRGEGRKDGGSKENVNNTERGPRVDLFYKVSCVLDVPAGRCSHFSHRSPFLCRLFLSHSALHPVCALKISVPPPSIFPQCTVLVQLSLLDPLCVVFSYRVSVRVISPSQLLPSCFPHHPYPLSIKRADRIQSYSGLLFLFHLFAFTYPYTLSFLTFGHLLLPFLPFAPFVVWVRKDAPHGLHMHTARGVPRHPGRMERSTIAYIAPLEAVGIKPEHHDSGPLSVLVAHTKERDILV